MNDLTLLMFVPIDTNCIPDSKYIKKDPIWDNKAEQQWITIVFGTYKHTRFEY